jgi:fatty-acyl-CoA synthase
MGSLQTLVFGATLVLPAAQFDPLATLQAIHEERCTTIYGVPTMFIAELNHPDFAKYDMTSLRTGIMAGAPCPIELMKRVVHEMHCPRITIAYGQTEASPVITQSSTGDSLETRVSTVGAALPCTEVKIVDPASGQTVEEGVQGELCARGYMVMEGYDNDPENTRRAIDSEGWLHTGDLAAMRPDGTFRITGRASDMIIRGGENVYPREIEEFLHTHPKITDAYVVGLPDEKMGERVLAWVQLKKGQTATEQEIRDYCRAQIAYFKVPEYIRFVDSFPMTVTGKIQKFIIRQKEIEMRGLEKAAEIETA